MIIKTRKRLDSGNQQLTVFDTATGIVYKQIGSMGYIEELRVGSVHGPADGYPLKYEGTEAEEFWKQLEVGLLSG